MSKSKRLQRQRRRIGNLKRNKANSLRVFIDQTLNKVVSGNDRAFIKRTEHHRLPRTRGGKEEDIIMVPENEHIAWHTLFKNKLPHELTSDFNFYLSIFLRYGRSSQEWKSEVIRWLEEDKTGSRLNKARAWYLLFGGCNLKEIRRTLETVWLPAGTKVFVTDRKVFQISNPDK